MKSAQTLIAAALVFSSVEGFMVQPNPAHPNTKLDYASGAALPGLSPQHKQQVQRRIRELSTGAPSKQKVSKQGAQHVVEVFTIQDFQREVLDEKERLVVVRFHAPWCRACKAIAPYYSKFMRDATKTHAGSVKFVDCPFTPQTTEVHETLGVNTVPFAHIYHPEAGLVEERRLAKKHYMGFERTAKSYLSGECELKDGDACIDPSPNVLRVLKEADAVVA